jgi:hypothetical protein
MDPDLEFEQRLSAAAPKCLSSFESMLADSRAELDDVDHRCWRLACSCGSSTGRVLGYSLRALNSDYRDPEDTFVGPLTFDCANCGKIHTILDSDRHGYHAEVHDGPDAYRGVKYRGEGVPQPWACPNCTAEQSEATAIFIYWHAVRDDAEDEPELPIGDFFNEFMLIARCVGCGAEACVTTLDKL